MAHKLAIVAFCGLIISLGLTPNIVEGAKSASSELLQGLLDDYGPTSVRPVKDKDTKTVVIMRLLITQIIALIETDQTLVLSGWLKWSWYDENLKWKPGKHGKVRKLLVKTDAIWMPDISLHANVDLGFERYKLQEAVVYHNGEVIYATPAILTSTCKINARVFPFDYQICNLTFSSWNYYGEEVDILPSNATDADQNQIAQNGVWELKKVNALYEAEKYVIGDQEETFPELTYRLLLERRALFHVLSIIIPCLLLSVLNLLVFLLPPEAGEKIGLGMTNLLALVLFQQLVSQSVPPSSDNSPIITFYFTPMIGLACLSILNAVFMLKLFYYGRHNKPVPHWIQVIVIRVFSKVICYTKIAYEDEILGSKVSLLMETDNDKKALDEDGVEEKTKMTSLSKEEKLALQETERSHRVVDWQNVALIWDKFVFMVMCILTGGALAIVFFLYVVEIIQNYHDFGEDDTGAVDSKEESLAKSFF